MDLYAVVDQVAALLQKHGRATYRALRLQFKLDDEYLEALKEELIGAREIAVDKDGKMLVWTGDGETTPEETRRDQKRPEETRAQTADASAAELPASAPPAQPEQQTPTQTAICAR